MREPPPGQPDDEVDEVVVDRLWFDEQNNPSTETESLAPIEKYGDNPTGGTNTDRESLAVVEGFWAKSTPLIILRWRIWPALLGFFRLRFIDDKSEAHYSKEAWFFRKTLALFCSLFFIGNWVLGTRLPSPTCQSLPDKIFYYGVRRGYPTLTKTSPDPLTAFVFV
jgi:osomolarity two-component system sensor histidine kinase SLN1